MTASLLVFLGRRDGVVEGGSPPGMAGGCQRSADDPTPRVSHAHAPHALSVKAADSTLNRISTLRPCPTPLPAPFRTPPRTAPRAPATSASSAPPRGSCC